MAKLPPNVQAATAQAEASTGYVVLPPALYRVKCTACNLDTATRDGTGRKASWELQVEQEGVRRAKLFQDVSHKPDAAGLMRGAFDAFGLTPDSDDAEFIGEYCAADVGVRPKRDNPQQMQNYVIALLPLSALNGQQGAPANTPTAGAAAAAQPADPWAQ
jgi:hypothetical protein